MPQRLPSSWLAGLLIALGLGLTLAQPVGAQEDQLRELKRRLLDEGSPNGDNAAFDLFTVGKLGNYMDLPEGSQDAFLTEVLQNRDKYRDGARRSILTALRTCGRFRVEAACRLTQEALDDPVPAVAQLAVGTFPTFDDERGTAYQWLKQQLAVELRRVRAGTPKHKQALGLIEALERMPNPIEAVGVLVTVLEQPRLSRAMENRLREALQRMTAQTHEATSDWRKWYDQAKNRSLAEWRLEVARRRDERLRRYETEAERYFGKLLASLAENDKVALFRELQSALNDADIVLAVRRSAIRELGTLGKRGDERAIALLRSRLNQPGTPEYDETKALVIEALGEVRPPGENGGREVFEEVQVYLGPGYHVRMRMAAAGALGALKAPGGIEPLLKVLNEANSASTPGDDLLEVVVDSLGRMGANPDGRVSRALMDLVRTLRSGSNGGPAGTASLLAIVSKSLGLLPYVPRDGEESARVAKLLEELAAYEDANVRFFASTALGSIPHASAFPALCDRLRLESASHVRKSILDAIGQRALDESTLVDDAIVVLVPYLDNADPALSRMVRQRLEELATRPPTFRDSFVGLELVVEALRRAGKGPAAAVPFLTGDGGLPKPDALTPVQKPHELRYYSLLLERAKGRLNTTPPEPEAALADFDAVLRGLNLQVASTPVARSVHLGKARALLRLAQPRPREALALAANLVSGATPGEDAGEVWNVALEAATQLKQSEPGALAAGLQQLQAHVGAAPPDVQRRLAELAGGPR